MQAFLKIIGAECTVIRIANWALKVHGQRCWNRAAQYSYLYLQKNVVHMLPWSQCMRVCRKYYSDLTLRAQVRSEGMAKVLQFKATVWPKVAPDRARKLKNSKIFWGSIPQTLLVASAFPYCKRQKAGRGLGTRLLANVVCPCCALASAVLWLRHWVVQNDFYHEYILPRLT